MAFLNSFTHIKYILHLHTCSQEASTGWARPEINDTKTPNWFIIYLLCTVTDLNLLEYFFLNYKFTLFFEILSICQVHILLSRTAQISLELHFCVELRTKKSPGHGGNFFSSLLLTWPVKGV